MGYFTTGLGATMMASTTTSRCPSGQVYSKIEQQCVNEAPKATVDYAALFQAVSPVTATFMVAEPAPAPAPTMAPAPAPIQDRCAADEYWDGIEQACYPKDAPPPPSKDTALSTPLLSASMTPTRLAPTTRTVSPTPAPTPAPEEIDENGFSPAPAPAPAPQPIPESDGVPNGGDTTVTRPPPIDYRSPSGGGGGSPYPYPSSGGGSGAPQALQPIILPDGSVAVKAAAKPFYESPVVLLGGAALIAYLVLRK